MFTIHFTNVVCSSEGRKFATASDAVDAGRAAGFEFSVVDAGNNRVASWTVFGGLSVNGATA